MEKLTVILIFVMLQAMHISGSTDCTPPWMTRINPFYTEVFLKTANRCPSMFGDSNKEYCCYNTDGDVECCNYQEYFMFRLICLIPIILIVLIILSFVGCMCYTLCKFCEIYKRRPILSCAPPPYYQTTSGFHQRLGLPHFIQGNSPIAVDNQDISHHDINK
ncbi:uncharacterized protein LOC112600700 [Melanaphis sacchari]|uniref:uncharacterized protein LOC112600700 n=1 Tax=Melanaphis sacchari TaxID=742174 RepID=UPI000DC13A23|nr:uncharacterized protein LOC112600700 [Melanaphis sacchari]